MRKSVLLRCRHLTEGFVAALRHKGGVVAEASGAGVSIGDFTLNGARDGEAVGVGHDAGDGADKASRALQHALHIFHQQLKAGFIVRHVSVARGIYSRRAVQRVNAESAVVRHRRDFADIVKRARLDKRVLLKAVPVLLRLAPYAKLTRGDK